MAQEQIKQQNEQTSIVAGDWYLVQLGATDEVVKVDASNILPAGSVVLAKLASESVNNSKLVTGAGQPGGAMNSWTPTLTNLTLGNGTANATYKRFGNLIFYRFVFTLGSTSAVGGIPAFSLPVTSVATLSTLLPIGWGTFYDATGGPSFVQPAVVSWTNTTTGTIRRFDANNDGNNVSATAPFTFTTSDQIVIQGWYEAA